MHAQYTSASPKLGLLAPNLGSLAPKLGSLAPNLGEVEGGYSILSNFLDDSVFLFAICHIKKRQQQTVLSAAECFD